MYRCITLMIGLLLFSACKDNRKSYFFEDCECDKIDMSDAFVFSDTLSHYSIKCPDETWRPQRIIEFGNGINIGDTSKQYLRMFGVTEIMKKSPWPSKKEQHDEIFNRFDVLEFGEVDYQGKSCLWHLVSYLNDDFPTYSLYITIEHPIKNMFYTLNFNVEEGGDTKKRLCEMEPFLDHFVIY